MTQLAIFSFILFITPCLRFLIHFYESTVCIALIITFTLLSLHMYCFFHHYNSGLLLKLIIITLLMYSLYRIIFIGCKIDFDKYYVTDSYRIYYYYILLTALYIIYFCELLIQPHAKIICIENDMAEYLQRRESFTIEEELIQLTTPTTSVQKGILSAIISLPFYKPSDDQFKNVYNNPNENIKSVIKIFPDRVPCQQNGKKYFNEIPKLNREDCDYERKRLKDSIAAIVPFYNEHAREIHATLRSLYLNFRYIRQEDNKYEFTHFNVLLIGDGWSKSHPSTKQYLAKLYKFADIDDNFRLIVDQQHEYNSVILQTEGNKPLCINPFDNDEDNMRMKVTTIIKIDNRKKANSHQWFLGQYGFAEWCDCDYMYFTDAYSTMNEKCLYKMIKYMSKTKNKDVICCTGRARIYSFEDEYKYKKLFGTIKRKS
eukprot:187297_1